ncbi:MAG: glycosyltransferase family 4 protein [Rikenellaceae bacterium]
MNILIVHNIYSTPGGEEQVVEMQRKLFSQAGHNVTIYYRNYSEIKSWKLGKIKSLLTALINPHAAKQIKDIVIEKQIDVVFIHNLYPIISPYFLKYISKLPVKKVMFLHNYRLICPIGLFLRDGVPCEKCGKGARELNCVIHKCEGSIAGSIGYALRGFTARVFKLYKNNVDVFVPTTRFQKEKLEGYGYSGKQMSVVPNFTDFPPIEQDTQRDGSVLYVGRFSKEKGYDLVFEAARQLPDTIFKMAGRYSQEEIENSQLPPNIQLLGEIDKESLTHHYRKSSVLLFPTRCYESFPLTILEAGLNKLPIVAAGIGACSSIIEHEKNGLLFTPSNVKSLVDCLEKGLSDTELLHAISESNYQTTLSSFSKSNYIDKVTSIIG